MPESRIRLYGIPLSHPVLAARAMLAVRMLLAMEDAGRLVAGRPAEAFARRAVPDYPPIPAVLPADWLPAARSGIGVAGDAPAL
ncbi:MAG TPA: hypothetical protein VHW96_14775 [Solirubrobacteraceae bacterium]|jgi:hypothetical protein|nr:hypothetical protein [Solirubrobacteraceae bacterium]